MVDIRWFWIRNTVWDSIGSQDWKWDVLKSPFFSFRWKQGWRLTGERNSKEQIYCILIEGWKQSFLLSVFFFPFPSIKCRKGTQVELSPMNTLGGENRDDTKRNQWKSLRMVFLICWRLLGIDWIYFTMAYRDSSSTDKPTIHLHF